MKKFTTALVAALVLCSTAQAHWLNELGNVLGKGSAKVMSKIEGMPTPLQDDEYRQVLKDFFIWWNSGGNDDFQNYKFTKVGPKQLDFCEQGLPEACGDYGSDFAVGLYTQRDANSAEKYLKYAINNTKHEGFRIWYEYTLAAAKDLARHDSGSVIKAIRSNFWNYYNDCRDMIGAKDSCMWALVYNGILPDDMMGIKKQDEGTIAETIVQNDIKLNGRAGSKVLRFYEAYLSVTE